VNHTPPNLIGVPAATLQAWLLAAQTALNNLTTGAQAVEASYSTGEGVKTVRYTAANIAALRTYIAELQRALGTLRPRRAIAVRFGAPFR
jgi:hypothetical protein